MFKSRFVASVYTGQKRPSELVTYAIPNVRRLGHQSPCPLLLTSPSIFEQLLLRPAQVVLLEPMLLWPRLCSARSETVSWFGRDHDLW